MKIVRTIAVGVAAVSMLASGLTIAQADVKVSGEAVDGIISPYAMSCEGTADWYETKMSSKLKKITHVIKAENGGTTPDTVTLSAQKTTTLTATVTASGSVSGTFDANKIIKGLGLNASLSLATSGSKTSSTSVSVTTTIPPKKTKVVGAGRVEVSGTWVRYKCVGGAATTLSKGSVRSHSISQVATAQCDVKQTAGSMAEMLKKLHC